MRNVIGAIVLVLVAVVVTGLYASDRASARLQLDADRQDSTAQAAWARHHEANKRLTEARQALAVAHAATEQQKRADADARALAQIAGPTTVRVAVTPGGPTELDTVPSAVVSRMLRDSLLVLAQARELAADSTERVASDSVHAADTLAILAYRAEVADLRHLKTPRLTWKAGAAIGSAVTLAAVVVVRILVGR